MKKINNCFNILFIFIGVSFLCLTVVKPAYAYLDPGTGSYMFQLLLGALLGVIYLIKMKWKKIKNFILSIITKSNGNKKKY